MRDERLDLLRFVGLAMIILAHVEPPGILFQARNFDVPLMVLASGMAFAISNKGEPYLAYMFKRFRRLVLPVWIFLTIYFVLGWGWGIVDLDLQKIFESYVLWGGIGYVWVIRVFLVMAALAPFIAWMGSRCSSTFWWLLTMAGVLALNECAYVLVIQSGVDGNALILLRETLFLALPYAACFMLGLRLASLNQGQVLIVALVALAVFLGVGGYLYQVKQSVVPTQAYKYPPRIYYISYAVFAALMVWWMSGRVLAMFGSTWAGVFARFVAANSIWFYLWHIMFLQLPAPNFAVRYILVFFCAAAATYVQVALVTRWVVPRTRNENLRKTLRDLLTG